MSNNLGNGANYSSWGGAGGAGTQGASTDAQALAQFMSTQAGSQFKGTNVDGIIHQTGTNLAVPQWQNSAGQDISPLMGAFQAWQANQSSANSGWQSYADLVAQQAGGEGTSTILGTQPTQASLLGAQGTIGNPANATKVVPTVQRRVGGI